MRTKNMTQGRKVCGILNHISEDRATHGSVLSKQNNRSQLKFGGFIIRNATCTEWSRGRRRCHMCSTWLLLGEILSRRLEKNIVFKMTSKKGRMKLKARHTHVPEWFMASPPDCAPTVQVVSLAVPICHTPHMSSAACTALLKNGWTEEHWRPFSWCVNLD